MKDTVGFINEWQLPAPRIPRFPPVFLEGSLIKRDRLRDYMPRLRALNNGELVPVKLTEGK